jgi:DeoR/GlpR family transcriptional regulator of sugar metabolism
MRLNDKSLRLDRLPHDVLTHEQAAQMLGVSVRTVHRDLQVLRQKEAAQ